MVHLSHQFRDRKVLKTYTAIVNGIPPEPPETTLSSEEASSMGVDVDPTDEYSWQIIDHPLDEKSAVTIWRALRYAKSLKAIDNHVTLVELKPKTGRYHQLRRHLSWVCDTAIIGDKEYDGGGMAMQLRERGLFLCSNRVTLEHPYYNSLDEDKESIIEKVSPQERMSLWLSQDGRIMVTASIELPEKFETFLTHEAERYNRLASG
jgi:23S rRNA-/tRNA-specific pseudouridylate synthase